MSEYFKDTQYGFDWGAAKVTRAVSHKGGVLLMLDTLRASFQVWVTPTGMMRIGGITGRVKVAKPTKRKAKR